VYCAAQCHQFHQEVLEMATKDLHNNTKLQPTDEAVLKIYEEETAISAHVKEKVRGIEKSANGKGFDWKPETLEVLAERFLILAEIAQGKGTFNAYFVEAFLGETLDLLSAKQNSINFHYVNGRKGRAVVIPQVKSLASFLEQV